MIEGFEEFMLEANIAVKKNTPEISRDRELSESFISHENRLNLGNGNIGDYTIIFDYLIIEED